MWVKPSLKTSLFADACVGLSLAACATATQAGATIDPDLQVRLARDVSQTQRYPVLIKLKHQPDASALIARVGALPQPQRGGRLLEALKADVAPRQAALLADLAARGAEGVAPLHTLNAVAAQLTRRDVSAIAARPDVTAIRYDIGLLAPSRRVMGDPCKPARPTPPQRLPKHCRTGAPAPALAQAAPFDRSAPATPTLMALGVPAAWQAGFTGKGVTVAIVDTGVDLGQADLVGSFRGGAGDWFDVHGEHKARPVDRHGHGTQIAGLVTGASRSGQTIGVAPDAKWIAARLYNDRNVGRLSDLHRVVAWLLDPDGNAATADAPQIVLNAWGLGDRPGVCDAEFATDIAWLKAAGMHVVFAAGNGGPANNSSVSPANNVGVLAVGALDASGAQATFTSRGVSACDARPYPDLSAPGEMVRTTDLSAGAIASHTYGTGTSFAAALVAGELALLQQARPDLTLSQRETLLRSESADKQPVLLRALGLAAKVEAQPAPERSAAKAAEGVQR